MFLIGFIVGTVVGGVIGFVAFALVSINSKYDINEENENEQQE